MNCEKKCDDCDCEPLPEDREFDCGSLTKKQKQLFKEYLDGRDDAAAKIEQQLNIVNAALLDAQDIADKSGVAFYSNISPLGQSYIPNNKKFSSIKDFILEHEEVYTEYSEEIGWTGSYT